ncbi:MAG: hypothetical protein ACOC0R_02125 [Mariniphaga sp.]
MAEQQMISSKRPPLLSALCILTFIGSTIGFTGYFLAAIFFKQVSTLIMQYSSWHSTETLTPLFFTLLMVLYALSLSGAIRMWKLHRDGFVLYAVSQLAILFVPVIWVNWNAFSFTNLIFVLVFITGYAVNLKKMK